MSVLIKGMDMPKCCGECLFREKPTLIATESPNRYRYISRCSLSQEKVEDPWHDLLWFFENNENKENWCPLVEVPTPHGRLIDADALIKSIDFETRHYVVRDEFDKGRVAGWNNVRRAADKYIPTIVEAEEAQHA